MRRLSGVLIWQQLSAPSLCELLFQCADGVSGADSLRPGSALRVLIGRGQDAIFEGQITAVEYLFAPDSTRQLRIRGYDLLHQLRKRQPVRVHVQVTLADVARHAVAGAGLSVEQDDASPLWQRVFQHNQTDLDLLIELAERCGQFLTLRGDTLQLITLRGIGDSVPLALGETLLETRVEVNGDPACRSVMAAGWSASRVEDFRGLAIEARVGRQVSAEVAPDSVGGNGERTLADANAQDDDQALGLAQAELDLRVAREVTLWGIAEGDPKLRPGTPIDVSGLMPEVSGRYVLTETRHTIDRQKGYTTEINTCPPPPRKRSQSTIATPACVSRVDDPDGLGRVKVTLPAYGGLETDWMGVLSPGAGGKKGFITTPDVGDRVLVLFAHEDPAHGVVLGGLFGGTAPPDTGVESGSVRRFTLVTPGGQRIRLDDTRGAIRVEDNTGNYLDLSPKQILLHGEVGITIEAPGKPIVIQGQTIDFRNA
jgi:phage protein D/phage baseplate assembly protein gpV